MLEDSFATIRPETAGSFVGPANPSIVDFIAAWLRLSPDEALAACDGAAFFAQVEWLARSLLPGLGEGASRSELVDHVGIAIRRLFAGGDPRWQLVHIGSVHQPAQLSRTPSKSCSRLIFVVELIAKEPGLGSLEPWLEERLEEESSSWEDRFVSNAAEPVALVQALRAVGRPTREIAERAKAHLLTRLNGVYQWDQLMALRELEPQIFPLREWADLQSRFMAFAGDFTDSYDDIEEVQDVDRLIALGDRLGVDLMPFEVDFVRDEVAQRMTQIEEHLQDRDGDLPRRREEPDRSAEQIAALFGRLAESARG